MSVLFPLHAPVGPDTDEQPDVAAIAHLLVPMAADADRRGVQRETIDRLAAAGLLGSPLTLAARQRELAELISGCDATTWRGVRQDHRGRQRHRHVTRSDAAAF